MKHILNQLAQGNTLSADTAAEAFELIMTGQSTPSQIGAFLAFLQARPVTVDELAGAARVMRAKVTPVPTPDGFTLIDTCGTGGDHSGTFNISTAAAIIAAGVGRERGVGVAKHGNRSVTSASGSSQVLEVLGVKLRVTAQTLSRCIQEAGLCFCFAPAHHPAMKYAAPIRQELAFRTLFNLLGPLTNPAAASRQVLGVYDADLTRPIAETLARLGSVHAMVVHGTLPGVATGLDEVSTLGPTTISRLHDGHVVTYNFDPASLGIVGGDLAALKVSTPEESARKVRAILSREPGPAREIACINAGAALLVADLVDDLAAGYALAQESIDSGKAMQSLKTLVETTQGDPTA